MFKSDKEELSFYRKLHRNMNAVIYVINLKPYRIEWISDNPTLQKILGLGQKEVIKQGESIVGNLFSNTDYLESIELAVENFMSNPEMQWTGVYRVLNKNGSYAWILYSASSLVINSEGIVDKVVAVAFDPNYLINTPKTLDAFMKHVRGNRFKHIQFDLTKRQMKVAELLLKNKTVKNIAEALNVSIYTVKDHKKAIYKKLDCTSLKGFFAKAEECGLSQQLRLTPLQGGM